MANKKITELNEASSITSADWLVMVDTGNDETKKIHPDLVGASVPIQDTAPASPEENDLWIDTSEDSEDFSTKDIYSNTETKTNKTWINNKPIYRIVIEQTINSTNYSFDTGVSNINTLVSMTGVYIMSDEVHPIPYNTPSAGYNQSLSYVPSTNKITIKSGGSLTMNGTAYVVLEYTKTTD